MKLHVLSLAIAALVSSTISTVQAAPPTVTPAPSSPVQVTNTSSNPVPVTGSVTSTVSGAVRVTNDDQNPVSIVGDVLAVDPAAPGRQPLVLSCNLRIKNPFGCFTGLVPAGKRMVVQMLSGNLVPDDSSVTPVMRAVRFKQFNGSQTDDEFDLYLPLADLGKIGGSIPVWSGNQQVFLILESGKGLSGGVEVTFSSTVQTTIQIYARGYLIDN